MWEGPSRPQQHSRGAFLLKKKVFSVSIHVCNCLLDGDCPVSQHSPGKELSYPTLAGYLESKVNVFLIIFCLLQPSPPLWLLFDPLSALGPRGKREGALCVYERREMMSLSYVLTCLYSSERNQQHLVCKTSLEIGNIFCAVQGKSRSV